MLTIPEMAVMEYDRKLSQDNSDIEQSRSIFIAGSKATGKTTSINNFLEKNEAVKETLVLDYSFGRKSKQKQGIEKTVCHVWEYGGKLEILSEVMCRVPRHGTFTVAIMVDLSKPKKIWQTLEVCFQAFDKLSIEPNKDNFNVVIIGGKYDIFKNFDTDTKKTINTTIRSLAMIYKAYVLYHSSEDQTLSKRLKQVFHFFGFGTGSFPKDKSVSSSKPLCIAQGSDSWESIGVRESTIDDVKTNHLSIFPTELDEFVAPAMRGPVAADSHSEPVLDALKRRKFDEMTSTLDLDTIDYLKSL